MNADAHNHTIRCIMHGFASSNLSRPGLAACGTPTSTHRIPVAVEMIGPIVEPHGQSLRTTNSCAEESAEIFAEIIKPR